MVGIDEESFNSLVADAIDSIPKKYLDRLQNVAFIVEDEPSDEQKRQLGLGPYDTLFGLYEGVPLPSRSGQLKMLPDKISLYRKPLTAASRNLDELKENLKHTIWHEVAHYFGLDHQRIGKLDGRR